MSDASLDNESQRPANDAASAASSPPLPGSQLAARRQELGWTIEHVASRLNLAPRQIEALESDNHAALPGLASTRGFIRAYAKLLKLDAEPLVATLSGPASAAQEAIPLRRPLPSPAFTPARLGPANRKGPSPGLVLILGAVVVVVAAAGAWKLGLLQPMAEGMGLADRSGQPPPVLTPPAASPAVPAVVVTQPDPAASTSASGAPAGASDSGVGTPPKDAAAAPSAAPVLPATPDAPAAAERAPATTADATRVAAAEPDERRSVVVRAIQDCWIDVRRTEGESYSRTIAAGSTERIEIKGGLTVILGNASGIEVSVRGKPVDVRARAKNNVTRLDLK